jgi:tRNA-splicing ligase RtcB (3'-phosphate/5'-hydroxy nucleic acid ligase)
MIIIKGKYNIAKVMLPDESFLDSTTREQIQSLVNHPALQGEPIVIMPDCHAGKGSVIGFTFKLNDYIIPNIVGVDIGCGMLSYRLGKSLFSRSRSSIDELIHKHIPSGFAVNNYSNPRRVIDSLGRRYLNYRNFSTKIEDVNFLLKGDLNRFFQGIGSLGGGNHFIEIGIDENEDYWLTIHTGSRNFGKMVCEFSQNWAKELIKNYFVEGYKDAEFIHKEDSGFDLYLHHMKIAQEYARLNRLAILIRILGFVFNSAIESTPIECVHNYINFNDNIIRKGAISANKEELVIIPFNMEDGLIIGKGKGNKEWNYSAPHGAGRILSRSRAKEILSLEGMKEGMQKAGIYTTCLNQNTLDESKGAYKNKDMILSMIKETVDVLHFVKPVYNFKAGGE